MVLVRRTPGGTNQSAVVLARQFTIPEDGHVAVEDLPGWPEATDDRFVLAVRVKNGTAASRDLAGMRGNSTAVFVTETGLEIEGALDVPSTTACTPSRG